MGGEGTAARGAGGMMTLAERAAATAQVAARFRARPFDWATGGTCVHLARAQMRAMGHRPPPIPRFRSALGARRALAATGFADLAALLDSMLPPIAPASMWVGDLALVPGAEGFDALAICDVSALFMYHDTQDGLSVVKQAERHIVAAWRL